MIQNSSAYIPPDMNLVALVPIIPIFCVGDSSNIFVIYKNIKFLK